MMNVEEESPPITRDGATSTGEPQDDDRNHVPRGRWRVLYRGSKGRQGRVGDRPAAGVPRRDERGGRTTSLMPLVGREREVTDVGDLLRQPAVRLVTLTGPAGVGKTRLALAVADEIAAEFPGGTWFVPLAAVRDPGLLAGTIARTLGVRDAGHRPALDGVAAFLSDKRALLVLDNFEHLLPAAPLVADLLARCPRLSCLVTSRALPRVSGEQAYPIAPLPLPSRSDALSVEHVGASPAVRLFVTRAQAVRPDFAVTAANVASVEAICRRLDGLPLALELAAARVRHFTLEDLANRLVGEEPGTALRVLTGGPRDAPDRQQTLRYAIAWSHDLLSPEERTLFRRLAVFVGGFTVEAAEAVVDASGEGRGEVVEGIAALVDQSLLQHQEEASGGSRYGMLETVREFALEQLAASGEVAAAQSAHAAFYLSLAERAAPRLHTEDQQAWLERLQTEYANLREALARAEPGREVDRALRLAAALWRFWHRRGYWAEGLGWLSRFLALAEGSNEVDPATRARAVTGAGWLAHYQNDFAGAQAALAEGEEAFRRLESTEGLVDALHCQSLVAQSVGENRRAAELCEEALALSRTLGDHARIAESLCNLSRATRELGDYARATAVAEEALVLHRAARHRGGTAGALLVLSDVARDLGQTAAARSHGEESLAMFRALGEPLGEGFALHNLAVAAHGEGDLDLARALGEESLAIFRRLDVRNALAEVLASQGRILLAAGEPEAALAALIEALQLAPRVGPRWVVAASLEGIAMVAASQGQNLRAVELVGGAAAPREQTGVPVRPNWQTDLERTLEQARVALGEATWAVAWARGHALAIADLVVVATAVGISSSAPAAPTVAVPATQRRDGLSPREMDVLRLLVAGRTDREIAEALYISPRTASKHVGNILLKLGATTRSEAAAQAVRGGLG